MGKLQKPKRLTWAPDVDLRQVRMFLPDECPWEINKRSQHHFGAKMPPSQIPLVKWKCPPKFVMNWEWLVVAGEESKEIKTQRQRHKQVFEAIFPRQSAIPPNPVESTSARDSIVDDQHTPLVPLKPIEEDNTQMETSLGSIPVAHGNHSIPHSREAFAFGCSNTTAVTPASVLPKNANHNLATLIDPQMIMKILLSHPLIAHISSSGTLATGSQISPPHSTSAPPAPNFSLLSNTSSDPISIARKDSPPAETRPSKTGARPIPDPSNAQNSTPLASAKAHTTKGINYCKSLIQKHGEEKYGVSPRVDHQSNQWRRSSSTMKTRKSKKPCMFFNTPKGCRNGPNCYFLHDTSLQEKTDSFPEAQMAKRMRLG